MTPTSTLSYQGRPIRLQGTMLNLTDMWRAAGCPEHRRPTSWLILEETARFRAHARAHLAEPDEPAGDNVVHDHIIALEPDGFVATLRGRHGGTWAHWQLALSYARYLSPEFHLWCNTVVRRAMTWRVGPPMAEHDPLHRHLVQQFGDLHRRLDSLERHAADLMFLVLSAQDILLDKRRDFSERSQATLVRVTAAEPFEGQCPCCLREPVLTEAGRPAPGAEFDHFFHRGLNRPEHGWLICAPCHAELTYGGYLLRFLRLPEFRAFQGAVLEHRRRERAAPDDQPR
ncbi:KilA-N domain-containing protein [Roseicella aerolata]|uniref:KilA-N domain-containing protein n=1 Tax=Roseicella aerolata TaxID=2883479 RepID=A0A9X1IJY2_9PROT|nr:KilA-N domain-containing protein [Roseicella aerolata]MCB4825539.1 KilA-N domain-containing protein [Roseicella aerolata]